MGPEHGEETPVFKLTDASHMSVAQTQGHPPRATTLCPRLKRAKRRRSAAHKSAGWEPWSVKGGAGDSIALPGFLGAIQARTDIRRTICIDLTYALESLKTWRPHAMIVVSRSRHSCRKNSDQDAPSPEEIRRATAVIRKHWSAKTHLKRSGGDPDFIAVFEMAPPPRRRGFCVD